MSSFIASPVEELPFTTLYTILPVLGVWITLWSFAVTRIKQRGVASWAGPVLNGYNAGASIIYLGLAAFIMDIGHDFLATRTGVRADARIVGYIYHLFLLQAPVETLLQVLNDGNKVTKYAAFVNVFMPLWSYFRIIDRPIGGTDWRLQAIVDCLARTTLVLAPRLISDLKLEVAAISMAEEVRWYGDLAILAFWFLFTVRKERDSETALSVFGPFYEQEAWARLLGAAIVFYAGQAKREEDKKEDKQEKIVKPVTYEKPTAPVKVSAAEWRAAKARTLR